MASRWQNPPTAFLKVVEQDFSKETKRIAGMMLQAVITAKLLILCYNICNRSVFGGSYDRR
jgi:hypothetical protein